MKKSALNLTGSQRGYGGRCQPDNRLLIPPVHRHHHGKNEDAVQVGNLRPQVPARLIRGCAAGPNDVVEFHSAGGCAGRSWSAKVRSRSRSLAA